MNKKHFNKFLSVLSSAVLISSLGFLWDRSSFIALGASLESEDVVQEEFFSDLEYPEYKEIEYSGVKYLAEGNELFVSKIGQGIRELSICKYLEIDGAKYTVLAIQGGAFVGSDVEIVELPEEGLDLRAGAFASSEKLVLVKNLDKANIVNSYGLFQFCKNLKDIELPDSLETIGDNMFFGCESLERLDIKNIREIGEESFFGCENLEEISSESQSRLTRVLKGAFAGCKNLEAIDLSKVKEIGDFAFFECENLSAVNVSEDIELGSNCFKGVCVVSEKLAKYDKGLEEECKRAEELARHIIEEETKDGKRSKDEFVDIREIDRLLYKYTDRATDTPNVVDDETFKELIKDERLVLYRGISSREDMSAEEINRSFREGAFYYPAELNGYFSTKYADHARQYSDLYGLGGEILQFCFTNPDEMKMITEIQAEKMWDFYRYDHVKDVVDFMRGYYGSGEFALESGLLSLGSGTMQNSFMVRAAGYDILDSGKDGEEDMVGSGVKGSQFIIFSRGKLTVNAKDLT